jgi:hypothetical protein
VEEKLVLRNKKRAKLVEELKARGYTKNSHFPKIRSTKLINQRDAAEEEAAAEG